MFSKIRRSNDLPSKEESKCTEEKGIFKGIKTSVHVSAAFRLSAAEQLNPTQLEEAPPACSMYEDTPASG